MDVEGKEAQKEGGARQRRALSGSGAAEPWEGLRQGSGGQSLEMHSFAGPACNTLVG